MNGKIAENLNIGTTPVISEKEAFKSSITVYSQPSKKSLLNLENSKDKLQESSYLTIVKNYNSSYTARDWQLAWKVPVGDEKGILADVYINATSGTVINLLIAQFPMYQIQKPKIKKDIHISCHYS